MKPFSMTKTLWFIYPIPKETAWKSYPSKRHIPKWPIYNSTPRTRETWFDLIFICFIDLFLSQNILKIYIKLIRLRSAGDNDQGSKRFCSMIPQRRALVKFHVTDSQNTRDQITSDRRSRRAWSKYVLCINTYPNECWLHTYDACAIITWRLGLRAPLVARTKMVSRKPELEAWGLYGVQGHPRLV